MKKETSMILAVFEQENDARDAFHEFHKTGMGKDYLIDAAVLYTKDGYILRKLDSFSGMGTSHNALFGWMIGALAGIFFGWKGVMVGALIGMSIGVVLDDHALRAVNRATRQMAASIPASHAAVVITAEETSEEGINAILQKYSMRAVRTHTSTQLPFHLSKIKAVRTDMHV